MSNLDAAEANLLRVRSFRNVLIVTSAVMTLIAVGIAVLGFISPSVVPLCFQPERSGQTVVVCPTGQSALLDTGQESGPAAPDVDDVVKRTAGHADLLVVELIGLTAAAVAAATALRGIRGSSEPYGLPVALATLKLPMGAVTAFLGLLLMRGQFVPGLSALDTSAQILAWALVFGYAQQRFTRVVDQQAHSVLDTVRGKKTAGEPPARLASAGARRGRGRGGRAVQGVDPEADPAPGHHHHEGDPDADEHRRALRRRYPAGFRSRTVLSTLCACWSTRRVKSCWA